ncbi:vesicle-fusing ATPase-like [Styela clava]|uniref:vesicle-fusing ATPase-like n=1 Tax=Styela clava TaxID=7725 RepID=UPI00193A99C3|nr:vesicle-fusing ATPase-like [Styela clava]XP_039255793.1 vesicle-fusing ATPase-like [Styela clava]
MSTEAFRVTKCPSNDLSLKNKVIVSPQDFQNGYKYIRFCNRGQVYDFTCLPDRQVQDKYIGFSMIQRKWAYVGINQEVQVEKFFPTKQDEIVETILEVDFYKSREVTNDPVNTDHMVEQLKHDFALRWFVLGETLLFSFAGIHYAISVKDIKTAANDHHGGIFQKGTKVIFQAAESSPICLTGKSQSRRARSNIINPEFDFTSLGIGGLDEEFKEIFRRAFASRVLPPDIVEKMGAKHVKGILLHGPPGCGKTLMARQIGKMLSAREPQIVNGPEILNKYVGESEANIRKLFEAAEEEQKKAGVNSGLHIIIFDEIDAICKQRGSVAGASGVHDTVVNQLLSKIDGVDQLNNILVIGMTNRPDLIDDALMRPGRLEVKKEIGLPDEHGRLEILQIHCAKMFNSGMVSSDVDLSDIAALTKNFSGAELAGLVRSAQSCAFVRHTKGGNKVQVDYETIENIKVCRNDFMAALENDIKPAYGSKEEDIEKFMRNGILMWGLPIQRVLDQGSLLVNQVRSSVKTPLVSMLLTGAVGSGKTALATRIAVDSGFPFVKICSPGDLVGQNEATKCQDIKKLFMDAYKSQLSCVVIDDIEKLMDYNPIGPRFSNTVAQALMVLFKNLPPLNRKLLVIATTSNIDVLRDMRMDKSFDQLIHVDNISKPEQVMEALDALDAFTPEERTQIERRLSGKKVWLGIKQLIRFVGTSEQAQTGQRVNTFLVLLEEDGGLRHA